MTKCRTNLRCCTTEATCNPHNTQTIIYIDKDKGAAATDTVIMKHFRQQVVPAALTICAAPVACSKLSQESLFSFGSDFQQKYIYLYIYIYTLLFHLYLYSLLNYIPVSGMYLFTRVSSQPVLVDVPVLLFPGIRQ